MGSTYEVVEPLRVGAQSSVARRLSHDRRRGGGSVVLFPAWPRRGSEFRHQDDGGQGGLAGRDTEDTLNQVTERLERTLEETPHLDFLRSFTTSGATTIFVNLKGSTSATEVADTWYHVRKSVGDIRHTLPSGVWDRSSMTSSATLSGSYTGSLRTDSRARASGLRRGRSRSIARPARCRQDRNPGSSGRDRSSSSSRCGSSRRSE